jgi:hypothetical protein
MLSLSGYNFYLYTTAADMKMLQFDGDGYALYYKRLARGSFGTPVYDPDCQAMIIERKDVILHL